MPQQMERETVANRTIDARQGNHFSGVLSRSGWGGHGHGAQGDRPRERGRPRAVFCAERRARFRFLKNHREPM